MRARRVSLVAAIAGAIGAGCAAVAGLDDFAIVACPSGCDAATTDGSAVVTLADGAVVGTTQDASEVDDAGGGDGGREAAAPLDGAIPIVPDCRVSTCPSPLGPVCSLEPCQSPTTVWQYSFDGGAPSNVDFYNGGCRLDAPSSWQRFLSHTLVDAGSARYELDFRALLRKSGPQPSAASSRIVQLRFGNTVGLTLLVSSAGFDLCNAAGNCAAASFNFNDDPRIDIYATAGADVTAGVATLAITPAASGTQCSPAATIPLPGPLTGDPSVDVGCIVVGQNCDYSFDNAELSAVSF